MLTTPKTPPPPPSGRMTMSPKATDRNPMGNPREIGDYMMAAYYRSQGVNWPSPRRPRL